MAFSYFWSHFPSCRFVFYVLWRLFSILQLNKSPEMVPPVEPPGGFCDIGCCSCLVLTGGFYVSTPATLHPGLLDSWRPPPDLSSTVDTLGYFYFCQVFPSLVCLILARVPRFLAGIFYPQAFFTLHFFRTFWCILWLKCGQEHPFQNRPCSCRHRVDPFRLARGLELLLFEFQDEWFVDCVSEPRNIE